MGKDTQEFLAVRYPNSYHLFPEFEEACSAAKAQVVRGNKARVCFDAEGIDLSGNLIVKCFELALKVFCKKK